MAVLEDGVGGLPGVVELLDVGATDLNALAVECIEILCRVGDKVVSMLVLSVVWRSFSGGLASSSSSSLLEPPILAPPIAFTASSLRLWQDIVSSWLGDVWWALPPLYWF
jgi:hypothetical protein